MKLYLDTDLFLAAVKQKDHLKDAALRFFKKCKKEELYTSEATVLEVWHYLRRNNMEEKALEAIEHMEGLVAEILPLEHIHVKQAILLAANYRLSPSDAIHAIYAENMDAIVATDHKFDIIPNLKKIDFSKS